MPKICVDADLAQLASVRAFVARTGRELDLTEQVIYELQLAVDEICSNVIRHGYDGQGGEIQVSVDSGDEGVVVTVRDWGRSFDPESIPLPDVAAPLEQRPVGGLGLFLVRQLMDKVEFEFDRGRGNLVTMTKRLAEGGER